METTFCEFGNVSIKTNVLNTVIIGTGAAGFNAALRLKQYGVEDIAIITEGVNMGTSRNTGSDKQTYYKLNLSGNCPDSPYDMAKDLFNGKAVDGDVAYAEASLSVPSFMHLAYLGVPFPTNRLGEYVGYKTDHDMRARATSAGPLTSKLMTECLEKEAIKQNIIIVDKCMAISILKNKDRILGVLCLNLDNTEDENSRFILFKCENVIIATGGPAGIYSDTVYPYGHAGSSSLAFEAGALGKNLTEWQFGLASLNPRWNVSGSYMQVLPRFISVDDQGKKHAFLEEYFKTSGELMSLVFKKGYEWPFDSRKVLGGSSIVDLLVYREKILYGRKVYLDFMTNPYNYDNVPYDELSEEAHSYLKNAGICFGTPIERLLKMNAPAVDLYKSKGVDITKEMLEIALCAQHNNGGIDIDMWWQTSVPHLFAVGECAGSHGVYRPGGSALNAGQAGSVRAAQYIAEYYKEASIDFDEFKEAAESLVLYHINLCRKVISQDSNVKRLLADTQTLMTSVAGAIRNEESISSALMKVKDCINSFEDSVHASYASLRTAYRLRDTYITQLMYLAAMKDYISIGGKSRGSSIYTSKDGDKPFGFSDTFRFMLDDGHLDSKVQNVLYNDNACSVSWRDVRPLPEGGGFFENVWYTYRQNKNIF